MFSQFRVLCVDDHDDSCQLAKAILGMVNIEVETANSYLQGYRVAVNNKFDLYLIDYRLQDGIGSDLCLKIKTMNPDSSVIIYSGDPREQVRQDALNAGAIAFLEMPLDPEKLTRVVMEHILKAKEQA